MDDYRIIELFFARSEQALVQVEQKYGGLCRHVAMNILNNAQDAEECCNDTLLRAWNSIPPQRPQVLSAFLTVIVRNLALDRRRYRQRRNDNMTVSLTELADCLPVTEDDAGDLPVLLNDFLGGISQEDRTVFILHYWQYETIETIADRLSLREGTVASKLSRTRNKLRTYLEKKGYHV